MASEQTSGLIRRKNGRFVMSGDHVSEKDVVLAALKILRCRFKKGERAFGPFAFFREPEGLDGAVVAYLKEGQYVVPPKQRNTPFRERVIGAVVAFFAILF